MIVLISSELEVNTLSDLQRLAGHLGVRAGSWFWYYTEVSLQVAQSQTSR